MPDVQQTPESAGPTTRMSGVVVSHEASVDYHSMTKDELQAELERRDLPKTGNKDELIERLQESD